MAISDEEFLAELDRQSQQQNERVRQLLMENGRPDLAADLDEKLRDIRLGIDGARATWAALSRPQKDVLTGMVGRGRYLRRDPNRLSRFMAAGDVSGYCVAGIHAATVNNLMARELVIWASGEKIVATENGRFVWKHGPRPALEGKV